MPATKAGDMAEQIARVAARMFAADGYDATPVRKIVEAAGVTKPTLYYYFGSKEGLAQELVSRPLAALVERCRAIVEGEGPPAEALAKVVESHFAFSRFDPDRARFVFALFFGPLGRGLAADLAKFAEELTAQWARAVDRLVAAGLVDPERAAECAAFIRGVMVIHVMDFLYRGSDLGPDLAGRLVDDLLRGFGRAEPARKAGR